MAKKIEWRCPECGIDYNGKQVKRGKRGLCLDGDHTRCQFLCECEEDSTSTLDDHGNTHENPCLNAVCYHCGWSGTFPIPLWTRKDLPAWAKKATDAGWTPPAGWSPPKKKAKR